MRFFLAFLFLLLFPSLCFADYVPGEVLVKFKHGVIDKEIKIKKVKVEEKFKKLKIKRIERVFKGAIPHQTIAMSIRTKKVVRVPDLSQFYLLRIPTQESITKAIKSLKKDPDVIFAEPNYIARAQSTTPNDSYFSQQWALSKVNLPQAWDVSQGSSSMSIAVVDTGVEYTHEDLTGKVTLGWDYANDDNDPIDDNGHGTHVAGIIGALTNNNKGVAGANWITKILAVKVLDSGGNGSFSHVAQGIRYAADNNASIINLSLGDSATGSTLQSAINYAVAKGSIIIASAGNENTEMPLYPAAYSNVLSVAATDQNDIRSVWGSDASNYGSWIDICAPGTSIMSTYLNNSYANSNGTSMSCPLVAGVAGLLLTTRPTWTYTDVFDRLKATAVDIDSLNPSYAGKLGSGRLDAQAALSLPVAIITSPATQQVVSDTIQIKGTANAINLSRYTLKIGAGTSPSSYSTITTSTTKVISDTLTTYTTTATSDGTYTLKLTVENTDPLTQEATRSIIIDNTDPTAAITYPLDGATITTSITIEGTASDDNLSYYNLEYSSDGITFTKINSFTISVSSGSLGFWNTQGLSGSYTLRLYILDQAGHTTTKSISLTLDNSSVDNKSASGQSYSSPNPFNPTTQSQSYISYNLSNNFNTSVFLFDITGKLIFRRNYQAGEDGGKAGRNMVPWDGSDNFGIKVPNGVYIYKVTTGGSIIAKGKIIVLY